jgi:phosphoribosylaminoimidazole-succinocarboxamide synthase
MNALLNLYTPQLEKIHSGKVRESFRVDDKSRLIAATDRISSFDFVLDTPVPGKGAVLNQLAAYWFKETEDIIPNHFIKLIDPNISLVKEAEPVRIEMIVRGYLTGSAWRKYQKGMREVSGVKIPDGMKKNQAFKTPIVTPTTKEESDREISAEDIFAEGWTTEEIYRKMEAASVKLFERGSKVLREKGIILVDTKYEFGLIDGEVVLIDEVHTPDSSRFWSAEDYEKNPDSAEQLDKEFVRSYLMKNKKNGQYPTTLPQEIVDETVSRYRKMYEMITGEAIETSDNVLQRIYENLLKHNLIKPGYVAIIMGSPSDTEHAKKMAEIIEKYGIMAELRVVSAHKNGERIPEVIEDYNLSVEPGAVIAVAGRSNGLGGALAANLTLPVISCPPFSDKTDMMVNINSSLVMPSGTPAATIIDAKNAALFALRSLNIQSIRRRLYDEINQMKNDLREADRKLRGR